MPKRRYVRNPMGQFAHTPGSKTSSPNRPRGKVSAGQRSAGVKTTVVATPPAPVHITKSPGPKTPTPVNVGGKDYLIHGYGPTGGVTYTSSRGGKAFGAARGVDANSKGTGKKIFEAALRVRKGTAHG